jgi:hypothetical protein
LRAHLGEERKTSQATIDALRRQADDARGKLAALVVSSELHDSRRAIGQTYIRQSDTAHHLDNLMRDARADLVNVVASTTGGAHVVGSTTGGDAAMRAELVVMRVLMLVQQHVEAALGTYQRAVLQPFGARLGDDAARRLLEVAMVEAQCTHARVAAEFRAAVDTCTPNGHTMQLTHELAASLLAQAGVTAASRDNKAPLGHRFVLRALLMFWEMAISVPPLTACWDLAACTQHRRVRRLPTPDSFDAVCVAPMISAASVPPRVLVWAHVIEQKQGV